MGVVGPAAGSGASAPRGKVGVVGSSDADGIAFEVRAFFPATTAGRRPVTGSLNAALAQWLIGAGLARSMAASRGTCLGRAGACQCSRGDTIWVGGHSVTCMAGEVLLNETTTAQGPCVDHLVVFAADLAGGVDSGANAPWASSHGG